MNNSNKKTISQLLIIGLKGLAMGAADVVPGVSGGTIAFISGIYEEFIGSLKKIDKTAFQLLLKFKIKEFWNYINGPFLASLFTGIFISIFSLAKLITYWIENYPVPVWSFFFGLILASIIFIGLKIKKWDILTISVLLTCSVLSYFITIAEPSTTPDSLFFIFISGCIAIIAMILPGISGAFILLLLGSYITIMSIIKGLPETLLAGEFDLFKDYFLKFMIFAIGAVIGLMSFSKILHWLFQNKKNVTLAGLTGFMIGSLNKVWPWKEIVSYRINSHGKEVPFIDKSISTTKFAELGQNPQIPLAIGMILLGIIVIILMEKFNPEKKHVG